MNVFEFIDAEKAHYPVGLLCKALDVSRPGYYAHTRRPPSKHASRDACSARRSSQSTRAADAGMAALACTTSCAKKAST